MRYISLFAGVGGFDLALNRLGHECVYANDFDKYCKIIYDKNFEIKLDTTDLATVPVRSIPNHDLLVGGFPCQSFSIAGKRGGFSDTRGALFFEICRILRDKRPAYLLLENVKGLLSHDAGKTFYTIIRSLDELGYDCQWQVLNSKNFGVPQNRERIFIVGHLRGKPRPKVFPFGENNPKDLREITRKGTSQGYRVYDTSGISTTLASQGSGIGAKTGLYRIKNTPNDRRKLLQRDEQPKKVIARTVRGGRGSKHGSKQNWDSYEFDGKIRRLTPMECERLQGFPDGWTEGVSDTQRYKQMGNAVTVNVVHEVARRLII